MDFMPGFSNLLFPPRPDRYNSFQDWKGIWATHKQQHKRTVSEPICTVLLQKKKEKSSI